ncbi:MAG TPA: IS701 family transposase [Alphaproteobacteria bacterium]
MALDRAGWEVELERWLEPFLGHLSHRARRRMCPLYIAGLIGPGDRKSVQPMAERLGLGSHDRLHHFVSSGAWNAAPLEGELLVQADRLVGGADAFLVIDDTALPKKGTRSVGVAPQYASALGKTANCQTLVSLTLARDEVPVPVSLRLFLPEAWTNDPERLGRAGVPSSEHTPRSKPEIALAELDRVREAGVRFGPVLADAGYGIGPTFRQALSARGLLWAVGIPRIQKVFPAEVEMVPPPPARRQSSQPLIPATAALAAEAILEGQRWRMIRWRRGTKRTLQAMFTARRVRVADGPAVRMHGRNNQHMPGEEVWLVGERRSSGERKYSLSNLPADTGLKTLAATIKARWVCEQAHQQLKEELGLDHFEGRSWTGLHRHALMTMIAFAFLQHQRLAAARRGKKCPRATASAEPAGDPSQHHPPECKRTLIISHLPLLPTTHHVITPQT